MHSCGGTEEKGKYNGDAAAMLAHAAASLGAPIAKAAELYCEWRGYSKTLCCAEQLRFRKDQVTRRDSVTRRATLGNWHLAAKLGFTDYVVCDHRRSLFMGVAR
jgi:hypothetical protein